MASNRKSSRRRLISSSDEDSGPSRRKSIRKPGLSAEKKSRVATQVETDSGSENDRNVDTGIQMGSRSSERLHKRYSRSFQMPSRDSVWSDIPTTPTSADKAISRLKPKKIVNNFTRITHRYNQDLYNSDGDDSGTDDFVVSDGTVSEEEEMVPSEVEDKEGDESDNTKINCQKKHRAATTGRHVHRVKGYHSKIRGPVSSSSESDNEGITTSLKDSECDTGSVNDDHGCDRPGGNSSGVNSGSGSSGQYKQSGEDMCGKSTQENDPDDIEWELRSRSCQSKRRQSRIESSSDSDQSTETSAKGTQPCTDNEIKNQNNSNQLPGDVAALRNSLEPVCGTARCTNSENGAESGTQNKPGSKCSRMSDSASKHKTGLKMVSSSDSNCDNDSNSDYTSNSDSESSDSGQDQNFDTGNIVKSSRARHQIKKQESDKKKKFEAFLEARRKLSASKRK
ncbi:clumping factor A-like [Pecten maximus]|uniref:clumping factor A-like n=1 Tax=Pecten maximus TaxID=6579 RepID=UPI001458D3AC|nr:clumping factor A-like [Pecten maximus]